MALLTAEHASRSREHALQLPDENVDYQFQRLLVKPAESWTPLAELQSQHFLSPERLEAIKPAMNPAQTLGSWTRHCTTSCSCRRCVCCIAFLQRSRAVWNSTSLPP